MSLPPLEPSSVDVSLCLADGWRPLWEFPGRERRPDLRFSTFLRPFARGFPSEYPADYERLPLHSYSDRGLVYLPGAAQPLLEELKSYVESSVRINTKDVEKAGSAAMQARARLAEWIHKEQGSAILRPLSGWERDVALGFPRGASSLPGEESSGFVFGQLSATGNSFAVPVLAHILRPIARALLQHQPVDIGVGWPAAKSKEVALKTLVPPRSGN